MNQAILQTMKKTAFAALGLVALATPADAKGLKQRLDATGVIPDARGEIKLVLQKATSGRFEIKVKKLAPSAPYELFVGTVKVATLQTNPRGDGKLRFRSTPKSSRDQLLGFDPRGARVALRGSDGVDVLEGEVVQPPGEELSAGKIICCEPDDDRLECEDRTADECVARGGTVTAATSCLPNPCADAPVAPRETVCCEPDDSGPECEDRTPAECAARGGVSVEATSCASNPCGGQTLPPGGNDDGGNGGGTDDAPGGDDDGGNGGGTDDVPGDDDGGNGGGTDDPPGDDDGGNGGGTDDAPGDDDGGNGGGTDDAPGDDDGTGRGGDD